jgi:RNA polymerase sigma factor (sigma-70 family)
VDYQKLLLEHLELVDRVVHFIARRHHLSAADTEEFASVVRFKLIDRDYAILRKFQGRSNLATYLTTVTERLYLDFCIARWGKWRPSATARRLGRVAMLLEQLLTRDGLTFEEAVGTLQTNHGITDTRETLHALRLRLPVRSVRRFAGEEELALVSARGGAQDPAFDQRDDHAAVEQVQSALARAVAALPQQDQLVLKLRFLENLSVAGIAAALGVEARPLYRRVEQIAVRLRALLQEEGITPGQAARVIGHSALTLGGVLESIVMPSSDNSIMRPSNE